MDPTKAITDYEYKPVDEGTWAGLAIAVGGLAGAIAAVLGADALLVAPITAVTTGAFRLIVVPPLAWFLRKFQ